MPTLIWICQAIGSVALRVLCNPLLIVFLQFVENSRKRLGGLTNA
ncbi:hypothetical protein [Egbenema bharatensis]